MNGQKTQPGKKETTVPSPTPITSASIKAAASAPAPLSPQENLQLKSEVSNLKQKIEAMTKNIDELTTMVQKVTLMTNPPDEDAMKENKKRTKVEPAKVEENWTSDDAPISSPRSPEVSPTETTHMNDHTSPTEGS